MAKEGRRKTQFKGEGKGLKHDSPMYGARFPEEYGSKLREMSGTAQYIRDAVITFMNLPESTIAKLDELGDRAKVIEQAIALLEERDLLDELRDRVQ